MTNGPTDSNGNFHGDDGRFVSLRDYIERILDERDKAVQVAYRNLEQRLDKLNELRSEVQQDRGQFLRNDVYQERHDQLRQSVSDLEDRLQSEFKLLIDTNGKRIGILETSSIKSEVLDALRVKDEEERKIQKRRVTLALISGLAACVVLVFEFLLRGGLPG
jgi:hypothetical protein